jgi:hypothetical protein
MKQLGSLPKEERPAAGKAINAVKNALNLFWLKNVPN